MPENGANSTGEKLDLIASLLRQLVNRERRPPRLVRIGEGAQYLGISKWQLRTLVQRGEIPIVQQSEGKHIPWLVDTEDLDGWIDRAKVDRR